MKRTAFTMIELIFVIVILGILVAVAAPKLAATSNNARVSKGVAEINTLIKDLGTYYITRGNFDFSEGGPANMTNVIVDKTNLSDGTKFYYEIPEGDNCIGIIISDANGSIILSDESGNGTTVCEGVVESITKNGLVKEHKFGGTSID